VIPDAAVEALARILANEALFDADIGGYGWDSDKDSSDHFMPTARKRAREHLEAAAPHLMALALEEAADEADGMIAAGDIAEVAAPVEGEYGRSEAVAARDSLYEDGPGDFLRARAAELRAK